MSSIVREMPSIEASHGDLETLSFDSPSVGNTEVGSKQFFGYYSWIPRYMNYDSSTGRLVVNESVLERRKESLNIEELQPVFCSECSYEHIPGTNCPFIHCRICFKTHRPGRCPFEFRLPQGADFDRVRCEVVCAFDDSGVFDENKWACTWCHRKEAKVKGKFVTFARGIPNTAPMIAQRTWLELLNIRPCETMILHFRRSMFPILGQRSIITRVF